MHVLPASDLGMSKLKIVDTVSVTVPLNAVPRALFGAEESTGMIR